MILISENKLRGGISSVMGNRYLKSDENIKILYADANNLYGHSKSQSFTYVESKFDKNVKLEDILNTPDDSDIGYFIEVDLTYPDKKKRKQKKSLLFLKIIKNLDDFGEYLKEFIPDTYTQTRKLISDWSDKKNYLVHY